MNVPGSIGFSNRYAEVIGDRSHILRDGVDCVRAKGGNMAALH
jgi:hypothetical protein